MQVDMAQLAGHKRDIEAKLVETREQMKASEEYKVWRRLFTDRTNLGSSDQLGAVLYGHMGLEPTARTATGKPASDAETLSKIDLPICRLYTKAKQLEKLHSTYLVGIEREVVDGFLHTHFNLNIPETYRSSSSDPNLQNLPIRDPELGRIIRSCFKSRFPGGLLVDADYGRLEVFGSEWYHHDPQMVVYLTDANTDMHRDMAAQCFMLEQGQVSKGIRFIAKGGFVFAEFYGDYHVQVAKNLWSEVDGLKLEGTETTLRQHLASKGITELGTPARGEKPVPGTFTHHIAQVEEDFWGNRFGVYGQWRNDWYQRYLETGAWWMHTGFVVEGVYRRNQVINSPIQGSAFHTLLQALIWLNAELRRRKMQSRVVCQIHDSIIGDVHPAEFGDYVGLVQECMVTRISAEKPYVTIPLEVEVEATQPGEGWHTKKGVA